MIATHITRRLAVGAALAASAAGLAPIVAAHAADGPTTITFQEDRPKIALIHLQGSKGEAVRLGDRFEGSGGLFNADKKRLGTVGFDCAAMERAPKFFLAQLQCTVTYSTAKGQIIAAGFYKLDHSQQMPIVGGSGDYAGARGTLSQGKKLAGFEDADQITLLP